MAPTLCVGAYPVGARRPADAEHLELRTHAEHGYDLCRFDPAVFMYRVIV